MHFQTAISLWRWLESETKIHLNYIRYIYIRSAHFSQCFCCSNSASLPTVGLIKSWTPSTNARTFTPVSGACSCVQHWQSHDIPAACLTLSCFTALTKPLSPALQVTDSCRHTFTQKQSQLKVKLGLTNGFIAHFQGDSFDSVSRSAVQSFTSHCHCDTERANS